MRIKTLTLVGIGTFAAILGFALLVASLTQPAVSDAWEHSDRGVKFLYLCHHVGFTTDQCMFMHYGADWEPRR